MEDYSRKMEGNNAPSRSLSTPLNQHQNFDQFIGAFRNLSSQNSASNYHSFHDPSTSFQQQTFQPSNFNASMQPPDYSAAFQSPSLGLSTSSTFGSIGRQSQSLSNLSFHHLQPNSSLLGLDSNRSIFSSTQDNRGIENSLGDPMMAGGQWSLNSLCGPPVNDQKSGPIMMNSGFNPSTNSESNLMKTFHSANQFQTSSTSSISGFADALTNSFPSNYASNTNYDLKEGPPSVPKQQSSTDINEPKPGEAIKKPAFQETIKSVADENPESLPGRISVSPERTGSNANIKVSFSWPKKHNFRGVSVGLFRAGQATNDNSLISRRAELNGTKNHQSNILKGTMNFRSPRSCGKYEFRLYRIISKNEAGEITESMTLARSNVLSVEVQGSELIEAIAFIHDRMSKDDTLVSGLLQMSRILEQLADFDLSFIQGSFYDCLEYGHDRVVNYDADDIRGRENVHSALRTLLNSLEGNPGVYKAFTTNQKNEIDKWRKVEYCTLSELYFQNDSSRNSFWESAYKCTPWKVVPLQISPRIFDIVSRKMERELETLIPGESFIVPRFQLRERLQAIVSRLSWKNVRLEVFGSSQNNFGSEGSDMDMCLVIPGASNDAGNKTGKEVLEELIVQLKEAKMEQVEGRLTARIPIIMFHDPLSGIDCDICVNNPLALRNTRLLYAYSIADPRVRKMAYIIKKWTKSRRINNPTEGTLSSYGYLLMLISYLQRLPIPVLPVLQSLHPNWDGSMGPTTARTEQMKLPSVPFESNSGVKQETYFYDPINDAFLQKLRLFGSRNTSSIGELLIGFFHLYAVDFDYSSMVVSIRTPEDVLKDTKNSEFGWRKTRRLCIEDPFELSYDVAHVLKDSRHKFIRAQFVRAYSVFASFEEHPEQNIEKVFDILNECVEELPFAAIRAPLESDDITT